MYFREFLGVRDNESRLYMIIYLNIEDTYLLFFFLVGPPATDPPPASPTPTPFHLPVQKKKKRKVHLLESSIVELYGLFLKVINIFRNVDLPHYLHCVDGRFLFFTAFDSLAYYFGFSPPTPIKRAKMYHLLQS